MTNIEIATVLFWVAVGGVLVTPLLWIIGSWVVRRSRRSVPDTIQWSEDAEKFPPLPPVQITWVVRHSQRDTPQELA